MVLLLIFCLFAGAYQLSTLLSTCYAKPNTIYLFSKSMKDGVEARITTNNK